jgi:hypothetical protein
MVLDAGEPGDHLGNARQRPQLGSEPMRPRPGAQRLLDRGELRGIQLGLPPGAPAAFSPARPSRCQAWSQLCTLTRVTANAFATSTCDLPRANNRAACSRRASIAAKSRVGVGMNQHAMVPPKSVHLFCEIH